MKGIDRASFDARLILPIAIKHPAAEWAGVVNRAESGRRIEEDAVPGRAVQIVADEFPDAGRHVILNRAAEFGDPRLPFGISQGRVDQQIFAALAASTLAGDGAVRLDAQFTIVGIMLPLFVEVVRVHGHTGSLPLLSVRRTVVGLAPPEIPLRNLK